MIILDLKPISQTIYLTIIVKLKRLTFQNLWLKIKEKILEKYKCRRLFCFASPKISTWTIPKEFIIDTSELKEIRNKPASVYKHTKSHDNSPSFNKVQNQYCEKVGKLVYFLCQRLNQSYSLGLLFIISLLICVAFILYSFV